MISITFTLFPLAIVMGPAQEESYNLLRNRDDEDDFPPGMSIVI